ncbi:hypothetical protein MP228_009071 [Amoeboaphelidium protococcarum]|nr:hypothetical protein MP228_009071 [Amoeboaphelidium protococcarum]
MSQTTAGHQIADFAQLQILCKDIYGASYCCTEESVTSSDQIVGNAGGQLHQYQYQMQLSDNLRLHSSLQKDITIAREQVQQFACTFLHHLKQRLQADEATSVKEDGELVENDKLKSQLLNEYCQKSRLNVTFEYSMDGNQRHLCSLKSSDDQLTLCVSPQAMATKQLAKRCVVDQALFHLAQCLYFSRVTFAKSDFFNQ